MFATPLRTAGALLGLALLLGCAGFYEDDDAVAELPEETGDTGEAAEEEEEDEEEVVDSGPTDTGRKERKPRDGERDRRDRKEKKPGGGKEKPKPKPGKKSLCFGGQGLDLRLDINGTDATGSLDYTSGKVEVSVPKLSGARKGARVETSGTGTVNGKKKKVQVQAGKSDKGPVVRIDGNTVKGAKIVPCK